MIASAFIIQPTLFYDALL